ncbi:hypothetical protein ACFE04_026455 [Oxalis oulophora]
MASFDALNMDTTNDPNTTTQPFNDDNSSKFMGYDDFQGGGCETNQSDHDQNVDIFASGDGALLPPPTEMAREEGEAFREWRRKNFIHLEEKEKREKEMQNQIIEEAEEFKRSFYEKRRLNCESNMANNREREKLYLTNQEKFHKEAHLHYWKAIAEIIPREVANIEKRGKKDIDKKPSIMVVHGPKPGKSTDLSRMRQMVFKLKQNPPAHMMPPLPKSKKDVKSDEKDVKGGKDPKDGKDEKNGKDPKDEKDEKNEKDTKDGKVSTPSKPGSPSAKTPPSPAKNGATVGSTKPQATTAVAEGGQANAQIEAAGST